MIRRKRSIMSRKYSKPLGLKRLRKSPYPLKQVMSETDANSNGDIEKDFQSTGRTGRRNALADVLGPHKDLSTSDLPLKLEKLSTNDDSENSDSKPNNCIAGNDKEPCTTSSSSSSS